MPHTLGDLALFRTYDLKVDGGRSQAGMSHPALNEAFRNTAANPILQRAEMRPLRVIVGGGKTEMKAAYLAGQCLGMIKASAFAIQAAAPGGLPFRACLPDNALTETQLVTVVLRWMEKKPDLAGESFIVVTMLAMAATWPCK